MTQCVHHPALNDLCLNPMPGTRRPPSPLIWRRHAPGGAIVRWDFVLRLWFMRVPGPRGNVGRSHQGRRPMKKVLGLSVVLAVAQVAQAADIEAGKELVAAVCAGCHGANGVSVSDAIP